MDDRSIKISRNLGIHRRRWFLQLFVAVFGHICQTKLHSHFLNCFHVALPETITNVVAHKEQAIISTVDLHFVLVTCKRAVGGAHELHHTEKIDVRSRHKHGSSLVANGALAVSFEGVSSNTIDLAGVLEGVGNERLNFLAQDMGLVTSRV